MLIPENPSKPQPEINENDRKNENLFSPRFRSVAAMAGWDEEALLIASLIVEDTPDRQIKHKKRPDLHNFKTPPSNSKRKRRAQRRSPVSIPITVLDLDEDESKLKEESEKNGNKTNASDEATEKSKEDSDEVKSNVSNSVPTIPCLDRLREELSCAICLDICYEPSTTPCGHSFCKKCLRSAADRCGKKCPKCRQLISNSRYCTVNTVLWNTIQLLFPQEVETRKANDATTSSDSRHELPQVTTTTSISHNTRSRAVVQALDNSPERRNHRNRYRGPRPPVSTRTRTLLPSQDEDAALALRLQREEFMEAFRGPDEERSSNTDSFATARANLRAMASRAISIRIRGRRD